MSCETMSVANVVVTRSHFAVGKGSYKLVEVTWSTRGRFGFAQTYGHYVKSGSESCLTVMQDRPELGCYKAVAI